MRFLAFDFETANQSRDSACSIGLVGVQDGEIRHKSVHLIRPPSREFLFTDIHGLTWEDVKDAPSFGELWPGIRPHFEGVDFVAAHNVGFDRKVLLECCARYGIAPPELNYLCTVELSRKTWQLFPTRLPDVCRHLGIQLNHHEALSDAEACARIVISAMPKLQDSLTIEEFMA